jgi:Tfp pilus assembly protein PilV
MALRISVGMNARVQERGSSLIEALVATLIVSTGVVTMAQLLSIAAVTNLAARRSTVAAIAAEQKLEELRTLPFDELQISPASALEQNTDGYVDYVGIYTRRWSIEPVSSASGSSLVIQVLVTTADGASGGTQSAGRIRGHARVVAIRTRRAP